MKEHWAKYGRNFYTRYDYEGVDTAKADGVMQLLVKKTKDVTQARVLRPRAGPACMFPRVTKKLWLGDSYGGLCQLRRPLPSGAGLL